MSKGYQAKDIPTIDALKVLYASHYPRYSSLCAAYPNLPDKVCLAKYNQLLKSGYIDGCGCGCSTVGTLTDKGKKAIADSLYANTSPNVLVLTLPV